MIEGCESFTLSNQIRWSAPRSLSGRSFTLDILARFNELAPFPQYRLYEARARFLNFDLKLRKMYLRSTSYAHFTSRVPALTHAFNCVQPKDNGILTKPIYGTYEGISHCLPADFLVLTMRLLLNWPNEPLE